MSTHLHFFRPTAMNSRRAQGFTLVEMLVVMGIGLLLTGLLVLGIRGFNSSTSRKAAVATLMGVLDQARTVAVSDGRPTYVVFVSAPDGQAITGTATTTTMWGRAYAIFEDPVLQDAMKTTADAQPRQRSTWIYLPAGVAFKCSTADGASASLTSTVRDANDATAFLLPGSSTAVTLPYVKFDSSGQIIDYKGNILDPSDANAQKLLRVLLFQGLASNTGVETSTNRGAGVTGSTNIKYALDEIILRPITGRAKYTFDAGNNLASVN